MWIWWQEEKILCHTGNWGVQTVVTQTEKGLQPFASLKQAGKQKTRFDFHFQKPIFRPDKTNGNLIYTVIMDKPVVKHKPLSWYQLKEEAEQPFW